MSNVCSGALRGVVAVGALRVHRAGRGRAHADHTGDAAHALARYHQGGRAARETASHLLCRAPRQTERHADDLTVLACLLPVACYRLKDILMLHFQFYCYDNFR